MDISMLGECVDRGIDVVVQVRRDFRPVHGQDPDAIWVVLVSLDGSPDEFLTLSRRADPRRFVSLDAVTRTLSRVGVREFLVLSDA